MADKRFTAVIQGRVQGVGFRYFAQDAARSLGITGSARNTSDGDVEIIAEGNEGLLARFIGLLRSGPTSADVTDVSVQWQEPTGEYGSFYIRH